ncbi:hypothetical protein AOB46_18155 [Chryseobacterium indologenes]|uniref:Uncharacterized protein n=1 Tax=Chryseobacterium indologenes TaxID=253 RepID=A0A0N0IUI1_CHRID|nr:hypothetical protein AOB46_18155 [Chryseobacterium indologenes]
MNTESFNEDALSSLIPSKVRIGSSLWLVRLFSAKECFIFFLFSLGRLEKTVKFFGFPETVS